MEGPAGRRLEQRQRSGWRRGIGAALRLCAAPAMLLSASMYGPVAAQPAAAFPNKPIHIVVPFAAGGPADAIARLVATGLLTMGQPVVTDNKFDRSHQHRCSDDVMLAKMLENHICHGPCHQWRHGISNLLKLIPSRPREDVLVTE